MLVSEMSDISLLSLLQKVFLRGEWVSFTMSMHILKFNDLWVESYNFTSIVNYWE